MPVDLHVHTSFSDSTLSPYEVIGYALRLGLSAIGITDHDTVDGIRPAMEAAAQYGLEIVPGVELSASIGERDEAHILGYYLDWENPDLSCFLKVFCERRKSRGYEIVKKLSRLGIEIDYERVLAVAGTGSVGRLHIARVLYEDGFVESIGEGFSKYLSRQGPCYVEKLRLSPYDAVKKILDLEGVPVLAHPWYLDCKGLAESLVPCGLRGIEVYHPEHSPEQVSLFRDIARCYGLLITGGSDCHGLNKGKILIGSITVDEAELVELKRARKKGWAMPTKTQV